MTKKIKALCVYILLSILLVLCIMGFNVLTASAYTGFSTLSERDLYNATNTYNISDDCFDDEGNFKYKTDTERIDNEKQYQLSYNTQQKNSNKDKVMNSPQITVLTHGLASEPGTWSNHYSKDNKNTSFAYDSTSLISRISAEVGGANIYWATVKSDYTFELYDITDQKSTTSNYTKSKVVDEITDVSKHIIVVFDAYDSYESNDNIYYQFNYMLSNIIYDVKTLNGGKLPKINLIGHSRGGLTNLQYALDHPDLVDSLVSIGTPYFASTTARLVGELFMDGPSDGLNDILNPSIYYHYNNQWNSNYSMYENIDVYAYGSYHTLLSLAEVVGNDYSGMINEWGAAGISAGLGAINAAKLLTGIYYPAEQLLVNLVTECLDIAFPNSKLVDLAEIIAQELNFDIYPMYVSWYNDTLVPLESQLGNDTGSIQYGGGSYYGFNRLVRPFVGGDADYSKVAQAQPPVGHNLEPRDSIIIRDIVGKLDFGVIVSDGYLFSEKTDGTIKLEGYKGVYDGKNLIIPSSINGKTVSEIAPFAFFGFNKDDIETITIANTVKNIGSNAFWGFKNVENIYFESDSVLQSIEFGAFANCSSLIDIYLPATLTNFSATAFLGCNKLENIIIENSNNIFKTIDGVVYSYDKKELIAYPGGKVAGNYIVSETCEEIAPYAFAGNKYIQSINLKNVTMLRQYCFYGCDNLQTLTSTLLRLSEIGALYNTKWLENQTSDIVKLGNVLVLYQGTASELSIEGVTSIAPMAFANNETLETVTLNNGLVNIGDGAFYGCSNLETVYICNNSAMIFVSNASFDANAEGRVIYVPYNLQGEYKDNELWKQYEDSIEVHQTNITYVLNGGTCDVTSGAVYYQDDLDLPTPCKNGNTFKGWYDNAALTGNKLDEQTMWDSLAENVTFYAKWEENTYKALLHPKGGTVTPIEIEYKISDGSKTLPEPSRVGYTFEGWYESEDYSGTAVTAIPAGTYEDKNYYAKWKSIEYMVQLSPNYPGATDGEQYVPYGKVVYISAPNRTGYDFLGWAYNDELYTDDKGQLIEPWAFTEPVTLVAQWQAKESTIVITIGSTTYEYSVFYDEMIQLPVPTKVGYAFQGWRDETGKQYTNSNGMMTIPWDKEDERISFVATWSLNTYTLSWIVPNTTYDEKSVNNSLYSINKTNTYTYESEVELATIDSIAYELLGWYTTSTYDEETLITEFSAGNHGNKTFYAKLAMKQYTITFNSNGGTSCTSMTVDYGSTITLPTSTKSNYKGSWDTWTMDGNLPVSNFGDEYTVLQNKSFTASWKRYYNIVYGNLVFMGQTAEVLWDNWLYIDAPNYYFYGYTFELERASAYMQADGPYDEQLRFLGWYTSTSFTTQKTSISSSQTGTVYVYAKWRYDFNYGGRYGTYTITDASQMNQNYDQLYLGLGYDNLHQELLNIGIKAVTITFKINMWRTAAQGTQYIYFYGGSDGTTLLQQYSFSVGSTETVKTINFAFDLEALGAINYINVRYKASTSGWWLWEESDTWKNDETHYEVVYVAQEADKNALEFYWSYKDPFD